MLTLVGIFSDLQLEICDFSFCGCGGKVWLTISNIRDYHSETKLHTESTEERLTALVLQILL